MGFFIQIKRVLLEINNDSFPIKRLSYNPATKAFKLTTERINDQVAVIFKRHNTPDESKNSKTRILLYTKH